MRLARPTIPHRQLDRGGRRRGLAARGYIDGIRVNAIAPGSTVTPFTTWRLHKDDGSLDTEAYDIFIQQMKEMSPLNIVGEADDQAQLILYLVSDASKYATGNIRVNGGQSMVW